MLSLRTLTPIFGIALTACQGQTFSEPPIHLQQNMDFQNKYEPQEASGFWDNSRAMRPPVEGTVAVGHLKIDDHLHRGKVDDEYVAELPPKDDSGAPFEVTTELLQRGRDRYEIYCTPCHGVSGAGNGMVVQRGMLQPPALWDERLLGMNVGYFYEVITNGVRNMPPYAAQIPVRDRWAIAAYVRVLQRSSHASIEQVPDETAREKGWK